MDEIILGMYKNDLGQFVTRMSRIDLTTRDLTEMYHSFMTWYSALWAMRVVEERAKAEGSGWDEL